MTQEQKDLLLKDLCERLPYGVRAYYSDYDSDYEIESIKIISYSDYKTASVHLDMIDCTKIVDIDEIKPYLFPLSSMTDEQIYRSHLGYATMDTIRQGDVWTLITIGYNKYYDIVDWLNENHFDYRGLIEKGLAIDATDKNIY